MNVLVEAASGRCDFSSDIGVLTYDAPFFRSPPRRPERRVTLAKIPVLAKCFCRLTSAWRQQCERADRASTTPHLALELGQNLSQRAADGKSHAPLQEGIGVVA